MISHRFVVPRYSCFTSNHSLPKSAFSRPAHSHPKTLLRERGFSLGVLIASCTANLNVHQISYWQTRTAAQTRCARNNHTNLNPRYKNSPPAGAPVNKTQPKAPLPQEGFGMNSEIMLFFANRFLCCWTEGTQEIAAGSWAALRRKTSGSFHGQTRLS